MIPPILFVLKILRNNLKLEEKVVPVIKRAYPLDKTPCVTLDNTGGSSIINKDLLNKWVILPSTHPQYDEQNPNKKYPQETIRTKYNTTINIHLWCDSENDRENLSNQIRALFHEAYSDHYKFCANFDNGTCTTIGSICHSIDDRGAYGMKHQCPHKKEYKYTNLFTALQLDKSTYQLETPFSLDDTTTKPPTLRDVHRFRISYYIDEIIGGTIAQDYKYKENDQNG